MLAQGIFLAGLLILSIFNVLGFIALPTQDILFHFIQLSLGFILGMVATGVAVIGVLGIHASIMVAGSGVEYSVSDFSLQTLFGVGVVLALLFSVEIGYGFQLGLGLATNALGFLIFNGDPFGISALLCGMIGIVTLIAGLITVSGSD
jgi:hypothetical protein